MKSCTPDSHRALNLHPASGSGKALVNSSTGKSGSTSDEKSADLALCPALQSSLTLFPVKDRVKFGMERSPMAGCCVTRFLGGHTGCCAGIKSGKPFEQAYIQALEKDIQKNGKMPKLDDRVIKKLDNLGETERINKLVKEAETAKANETVAERKTKKPEHTKPRLQRIAEAPFRWLKWIAIGFWEDLKLLLQAKRA